MSSQPTVERFDSLPEWVGLLDSARCLKFNVVSWHGWQAGVSVISGRVECLYADGAAFSHHCGDES